jgi:hypothetical protein
LFDKDNPNKNQLAKQKFGSAGELESDSGVCLEEKSGRDSEIQTSLSFVCLFALPNFVFDVMATSSDAGSV